MVAPRPRSSKERTNSDHATQTQLPRSLFIRVPRELRTVFPIMKIISHRRDSTALLALFIIVSILLFFVLKMPLSRFEVPYTFASDAITKIMHVVNVSETGWLLGNDRLGYPFGFDRLDFPRFDSLNYAIMGPIAAITGEAGLAVNLYFLATFYLIALSAFWCLRRIGLDAGPSLICALIFAFLPYHLARGIPHLTNGAYFLVPPAMLVLIRLAQDRIGFHTPDARRRWLLALLIVVLLPLQTPYNGVFFAFLCLIASAIALAQGWQWRKVLVTLSLLAALGGTFMIEQIPRIVHQAENGPAGAGQRSPAEAQTYSMQLHQVIIPTTQHRVGFIREQATLFNERMQVPNSEVRNQYIGVIGLLGLCALLWTLFRSINRRPIDSSHDELESSVRITALLALATILIAISTGLGTLIAYFLTSSIRAYNRMFPFLAFAALIGGGWLLHLLMQRIGNAQLRMAAMVTVGAFLLFDIVPQGTLAATRNAVVADYDRTRGYFTEVEARLGNGTALFQMPVIWYPEHPPVNRMTDYDNLKPFLLTKTLRFSAGSGRQRPGYTWGRFVERQPASDIVARTHAEGFGAILVDSFAYTPEDLLKITDGLAQALPEPPFISPDQRWWTFSLAGCCDADAPKVEPGTKPDIFAYTTGSEPIRFTPNGTGSLYQLAGWHNPEGWGTWTSSDATLRLNLTSVPVTPLLLLLDTRMMLGPNVRERTLRIECNGNSCGEFIYSPENPARQLEVTLPSGLVGQNGRLDLRFVISPEATPKAAGVNNDVRSLGIGLTSLSISPAE